MTENEYVIAGNVIRVRQMRCLLFDILSGDNWGVTDDEKKELGKILSIMVGRLENMIDEIGVTE